MNRKEKIEFLNGIRAGKGAVKDWFIKSSSPLPSWYWQQFETREELLSDLKKSNGENIIVIWWDGRPYLYDFNLKRGKPQWFTYE